MASLDSIWDEPAAEVSQVPSKRPKEALFLSDSDEDVDMSGPSRQTDTAPVPPPPDIDIDALFADFDEEDFSLAPPSSSYR